MWGCHLIALMVFGSFASRLTDSAEESLQVFLPDTGDGLPHPPSYAAMTWVKLTRVSSASQMLMSLRKDSVTLLQVSKLPDGQWSAEVRTKSGEIKNVVVTGSKVPEWTYVVVLVCSSPISQLTLMVTQWRGAFQSASTTSSELFESLESPILWLDDTAGELWNSRIDIFGCLHPSDIAAKVSEFECAIQCPQGCVGPSDTSCIDDALLFEEKNTHESLENQSFEESQAVLKIEDKWKNLEIEVLYMTGDWANTRTQQLRTIVIPGIGHYLSSTFQVHPKTKPLSHQELLACPHSQADGVAQQMNFEADVVFEISLIMEEGDGFGWQVPCVLNDDRPVVIEICLREGSIGTADQIYGGVLSLFLKGLGTSRLWRYLEKLETPDFGSPVTVLKSPNVALYANTHYQDHVSIPLSEGTDGVEWSARALMYDVLSNTPAGLKLFVSNVTLALFEDLGWYKVNYTQSSSSIFGAKKPNFLTTPCIDENQQPNFPEFCMKSEELICDFLGLHKGLCRPVPYLNGCPVIIDPTNTGNCQDPMAANLNSEYDEEACPECRCLMQSRNISVNVKATCHRVKCTEVAMVKVGKDWISCPVDGGNVTLPSGDGLVQCPSYDRVCGDYGCPTLCSGYGKCRRGKCECEAGRFGPDCGLTQSSTLCTVGYFYDAVRNECMKCSSACLAGELASDNCLSCFPALHTSVCDPGYTYNETSQECEACTTGCLACPGNSKKCTTCADSFVLTSVAECECPEGDCYSLELNLCMSCTHLHRTLQSSTFTYPDLTQQAYYDTVAAVVPANGKLYYFIRGVSGISFSVWDPSTMSWSNLPWYAWLTDADGWNSQGHYDTIRLATINNLIYIFGRGTTGPYLASLDTTTNTWTTYPSTNDINDAQGYNVASLYQSIRMTAVGTSLYVFFSGSNALNNLEFDTIAMAWRGRVALVGMSDFNYLNQLCYMTYRQVVVGTDIYFLARTSTGILMACFHTTINAWGPKELVPALTDSDGFGQIQYTSTFGVLLYDTDLYVFMRGSGALYCFSYSTTGDYWEMNSSFWAYSNSYGWGTPSYYSTFQYVLVSPYIVVISHYSSGYIESKYNPANDSWNYIFISGSYFPGLNDWNQAYMYTTFKAVGSTAGYFFIVRDNNFVTMSYLNNSYHLIILKGNSPCDNTCQKCTSTTANSCSSCWPNAALTGPAPNSCTCNIGYFIKSIDNQCLACYRTCATCTDTTIATCLTCRANASLSGAAPNTCICNPNSIPSPDASNCLACYKNCATCVGTYSTQCAACYTYASLVSPPISACECITGYYLPSYSSACKPCETNCATCGGSVACLTCTDAVYMSLGSTACSCIPGYYLPSGATTCSACGTYCDICLSPTICTTCKSGYYLPASSTTCSPCDYHCICTDTIHMSINSGKTACSCIPGYYLPSGTMTCLACGMNCDVCVSPTICTTCTYGYYLIASSATCSSCGTNCACSGPAHCQSCTDTQNMSINNQQTGCYCNTGYYLPAGATKCLSCGTYCNVCVSPTICTTCTPGYYLPASLTTCTICGTNCACSGSTQCSSCTDTRHMSMNSGKTACSCILGYYLRLSAVSCSPCRINCDVCISPSICTTCSFGYFLPASSTICSLCGTNCICSGSTQCSTCIDTIHMSINSEKNACSCILGYYLPSGTMTCLACGMNCDVCVSPTICTTCTSGYYLIASSATCSPCGTNCACGGYTQCSSCIDTQNMSMTGQQSGCNCNSGYYLPAGSPTCAVCGQNCATCEGSTKCSTCKDPSPHMVVSQDNTSCNCIKGYYLYSATTTCIACGMNCAACDRFSVCTVCNPLSTLSSGACVCVLNAIYDQISGVCVCISGYEAVNNICIPCLSYYQASDVTARMNANYMQVQLMFARAVNTANLHSCNNIFDANTLAKFGTAPSCVFPDSTHLTVIFGHGATLINETIDMIVPDVHSTVGSCSYTIAALTPTVVYPVKSLVPEAIIIAPASYSLSCNSTLQLSALSSSSGAGRPLLYKWNIATGTQTVSSQYNSYSSNYGQISIPNDQLPSALISVHLSVMNFLGNSDSADASLYVTSIPQLSLSVDGGTNISIKSSETRRLKVNVDTTCLALVETYQYVWSFVQATPILPTTVNMTEILNGAQTNTLIIPALRLRPGVVYELQCNVTGGGLSDMVHITITVPSSPLQVICDRSDGASSAEFDLVINCTASFDPDFPSVPVTSLWACSEDSEICMTATGNTLTFANNNLMLAIPAYTLVSGHKYNFTLTVSKDVRSASKSISFSINNSTLQVVNTFTTGIVTNQRPIVVAPEFSGTGSVNVSWSQVSGSAVMLSTPISYPFLSIPPGKSTAQGLSYQFQLNVVSGSGTISLIVNFMVAIAPQGGTFTVSQTSAQMFTLTSSGWEASDDSYYPLTQSFGYVRGSTEVLFSLPQLGPSLSSVLLPGSYPLLVKVCDSLPSCTSDFTPVAATRTRALQSTDFTSLFDRLTVDQDMVIPVCVNMMSIYSGNQAAWDQVRGKLSLFISTFSSVSEVQLMAFTSCLEALNNGLQMTSNFNTVKSDTFHVLGLYHDGLYESLFTRLLQVFQNYQITSTAGWFGLFQYYLVIEQLFLRTFLPGQTPYTYAGSALGFNIKKIVASDLNSGFHISAGNFSVSISPAFLSETGILESQTLNIIVNQFNNPLFPAGVISILVQSAGTFVNLNYIPADPRNLTITNLKTPINVTVPLFSSMSSTLQCLFLSDTDTWEGGSCPIIRSTATHITFGILRIGVLTVVPTNQQFVVASPLPDFPATQNYTCDHYFGPIYILIYFTVLTFVLIVIEGVSGSHTKKRKRVILSSKSLKKLPTSTEQAEAFAEQPVPIIPSDNPEILNVSQACFSQGEAAISPDVCAEVPHCEAPEVPFKSARNMHDRTISSSVVREGMESARGLIASLSTYRTIGANTKATVQDSEGPRQKEEEVNSTSVVFQILDGHYFLGIFLHRMYWGDLVCFLTIMMCHLFFLGVFYYFFMDSKTAGPEVSATTFLHNYEWEDVKYYLWTFLLSLVVSAFISTVRTIGEMKTGRAWTVALIVLCMGLNVLFDILIGSMNTAVCYEYAGRWCVGFLWCALTEVTLLEPLVAAYRYLLLKRVSSSWR